MASIVQRGGSYSVVYYTNENGIRKQKWESFRSEKDALHRKRVVEYCQQVKKELAHCPQTVGQLIQEYVWLYGRTKWSLSPNYRVIFYRYNLWGLLHTLFQGDRV